MKKIFTLMILLTFSTFASEKATLTSEYLIGNWCYVYMETPDELVNENWEFKEDGKFMAQTSEYNPKMKHTANWKIEDTKLNIKPKFMGGPHKVKILSENEFTYKFFVEMYIQRGQCKK